MPLDMNLATEVAMLKCVQQFVLLLLLPARSTMLRQPVSHGSLPHFLRCLVQMLHS